MDKAIPNGWQPVIRKFLVEFKLAQLFPTLVDELKLEQHR
jgi:hypothetical protein